jgi:hypothetical protein
MTAKTTKKVPNSEPTAKNKANSSSKSLKKFFHLINGSEEMYITALASFFCAFFVYKWMVGPDVNKMQLVLIAVAVFSGGFLLAFFVGYGRYLNGSNFRFKKEVDTPNRNRSKELEEMDYRIEEMKEDARWRENEEREDHDREYGR